MVEVFKKEQSDSTDITHVCRASRNYIRIPISRPITINIRSMTTTFWVCFTRFTKGPFLSDWSVLRFHHMNMGRLRMATMKTSLNAFTSDPSPSDRGQSGQKQQLLVILF